MREKFIYWLANILGVDMMASVRPNNGIDIISHEHKVVNVRHSYMIPRIVKRVNFYVIVLVSK